MARNGMLAQSQDLQPSFQATTEQITIGIDLGDRFSHCCVLGPDGKVLTEGRVRSTPEGMARHFRDLPSARIALEVGAHSRWASQLLTEWGHEVIVANPRNLRMIADNIRKSDHVDAHLLARLARVDPKLLAPITHHSNASYPAKTQLKARDLLVRNRTRLMNAVRGILKAVGRRVPPSGTSSFPAKAELCIPDELKPGLMPLLETISHLNQQIYSFDKAIEKYKKIVQSISPLVGDAGVSIEVFSDLDTTAEEMLAQGQEMFSWISNAYVKYPCTHEGLRAAEMSVQKSIRVNITLCFSQEQAAAVYAATKRSKEPVYVSPFVGRLDDFGDDGMDLVRNIKKMYANGDGHVHVLAASIRNMNQLLCSFALGAELATVPTKLLEEWAAARFPMPGKDFRYKGVDASGKSLKAIAYKALELEQPWGSFDLNNELTTKGIQNFVADYQSTLSRSA